MLASSFFATAKSLIDAELARRPGLQAYRRELTLAVFESLVHHDVCDRIVATALAADVVRKFEASL